MHKKSYYEINHIVAGWIKNYAEKNGIKCLVIGVSGGIDSALVSYLCALTGLKVYVVSMPIHQAGDSVERAADHILWLKERFPNVEDLVVPLSYTFDVFDSILSKAIGEEDPLCSANTRARMRMTTLYHIATKKKGIVVGTGNKVEDFGVGFFIKYGDGGVDISPIAVFMKSEVRQMAIAAEITDRIIKAIPSDDLYKGALSDEEQIGATYDELEWAMEWDMIQKSKHPMAPSFKLSKRQAEVYEIFKSFNLKNHHKMVPIPIFPLELLTNMANIKEVPFVEADWVFERGSGHRGYRNTKTGDWVYEKDYNEMKSISDFSLLSETIMASDKNIKCLRFYNTGCVKCDVVEKEMVKIGAFVMCHDCFMVEFGVDKFPVVSEIYETTYRKWLKIYQKKANEED